MKLIAQLLAHISTLQCDDPEWALIQKTILPIALKSHRADDLHVKGR